jgi:hypothetical protein
MTIRGGKSLGPGPRRFAETTHSVMQLFTEVLVDTAERSGGSLTAEDIRELFDNYNHDIAGLDAIYQKAWDQAIGLWLQSQWERARTQLVERMLVNCFDRALAPRGAEAPPPGKLSRRVVPAFITALKTMLGEDMLQGYQERVRAIVERLKQDARGEFDWQVVYDDVESGQLVDDILIAISGYFDDMEKRIEWCSRVVNSNLGPPTPGGADATWYFDEAEFHILFSAMYADLRASLDTDDGETEIENRHGLAAPAALRRFLSRLDYRRRTFDAGMTEILP